MLHPVRGVLAIEDEQTGDGRYIAPGALTWADPPLPLGWLEEEMHGQFSEGGPQVGNILTIERVGNEVQFTGQIDDEIPEGADVIRRMQAGSAPMGTQFGLSIDPDDWELELVARDAPEEVLLLASGAGPIDRRTLTAAAGDGNPEGTVLVEMAVDDVVERYTRLRIRGATACAIPAFAGAYLELGTIEEQAGAVVEEAEAIAAAIEAPTNPVPSIIVTIPSAPPASWFMIPEPDTSTRGMLDMYGMPAEELLVEQEDGGLAVPFQVLDDGRCFGNLARWGQCHTGYPDACITPPDSATGYRHFHTGQVVTAEGQRLAVGVLTANCDHAARHLLAPEATDHYAHSGLGWADVQVTSGKFGPWASGAVRPSITSEQLRVLRASSISGDWRRIDGHLELIAALSVNTPGFPIARMALAASGLLAQAEGPRAPQVHLDHGKRMSLVAAGIVQRCPECQRRAALDALSATGRAMATADEDFGKLLHTLETLDRRTRHLMPDAAAAMLARIRR